MSKEGNQLATEEYIKEMRSGKGKTESVIKDIRNDKAAELQAKRAELEIEKLKAQIRKIQGEGQPMQPGMVKGFVGQMLAANLSDPKRAKAFLDELGEENMNKLAFLMAAESDRTGALMNLAKSPGTSVKDLVEIVKLMRPSNGGVNIKDLASIFNAGVNAAKVNQPQPSGVEAGLDVYEKFVKPFVETLASKDKELVQTRIDNLAEKIVNPMEWFKSQKAIAAEMGLTSTGKKSELDLKLEEMRQSHDIDMERLRWEQQKFILGLEADQNKWGAISKTFSPIFAMAAPEIRNQLRKAGAEVGKMINPRSKTSEVQPPGGPQIAKFTCPECNVELAVPIPPGAPEEVPIKCPKCGTVTPAKLGGTEAPPPEEKPPERKRLSYKMG